MYTTYQIKSWHWYQRVTPSSEHTIERYNKSCEEDAKRIDPRIMVLRDNVVELTGYYYYGNGFPIENCARTEGYVDVRTGKVYPGNGGSSFCKDLYLNSGCESE